MNETTTMKGKYYHIHFDILYFDTYQILDKCKSCAKLAFALGYHILPKIIQLSSFK
jgi:hypothetical protein